MSDDAHNAALAASRGAQLHMEACRALLNVPDDEVLYGAIEELQQQLAAERDNYEKLYDGIIDMMPQEFRQNNKGALHSVQKALAALADEREKLADRHKLCVDYETKWKAEKEKSRILGNMIDGVDGQPGLRQQLAAEMEKVQILVDTLKSARFKVTTQECQNEIDAALARVKEGK